MDVHPSIPAGQDKARSRWGTHASGAAFDRKKTPYLTEQARHFIAQQGLCAIAGLGPEGELCGLLALGEAGFVRTLDPHTCLVPLDRGFISSRLYGGMRTNQASGRAAQVGLFFICHPTRERLCVQGTATLLPGHGPVPYAAAPARQEVWMSLQVRQVFFHCAKYIRTRVPGLSAPISLSAAQRWQPEQLLGRHPGTLSEAMRAFIAERVLCFLCTVNQQGDCAINHRGGAPGFLVTLPPEPTAPRGMVLLPDYSGNGAFEAIGNILETGRAALLLPDYGAHFALCVSGPAAVIDAADLSPNLARRCRGAQRVVALLVQGVELQRGNWSRALAAEQARAEARLAARVLAPACPF